jgi:membrane protease YdiL (CAAX protease family)
MTTQTAETRPALEEPHHLDHGPPGPDLRDPPPGFGRWPWWTPLCALPAGLVAFAPVLLLLGPLDFPFKATLGEGLLCTALLGSGFVLMSRYGRIPRPADLGLRPTPSRAAVGWVIVARITFAIIAAIYVVTVGGVTPNVPIRPAGDVGTLDLIDFAIAVVVVAPFAEELFFRGYMYATLRGRLSVFWAALTTGILFAAIHPVYGDTKWNLVPVLALAGITMCLLYERTGSLWPAIAFHFVMNVSVLWLVTDSVALPVALVGGAGLLFLIAPWRFVRRARSTAPAGSLPAS